jgi:hypothetical protein
MEQNQGSSGATEAAASGAPGKEDVVAYETHRKLLGEKKRLEEQHAAAAQKIKEYESQAKLKEESELKQKEEWKKLLEIREKELAEAKQQVHVKDELISTSLKRRALLDAVNGSVPEQYWGLMPLEEIALNPETGMPDESSVQAIARKFESTFADVVKPKGAKGLPNTAAGGPPKKMTVSEWKQLPSSKEMKAKMAEVDWNTE